MSTSCKTVTCAESARSATLSSGRAVSRRTVASSGGVPPTVTNATSNVRDTDDRGRCGNESCTCRECETRDTKRAIHAETDDGRRERRTTDDHTERAAVLIDRGSVVFVSYRVCWDAHRKLRLDGTCVVGKFPVTRTDDTVNVCVVNYTRWRCRLHFSSLSGCRVVGSHLYTDTPVLFLQVKP